MADNKETLTCPACGKKMKKIFVSSANCNIDVCIDGCGGIFFDNREYKKMDENAECIKELVEALKDKSFQKVNTSETRVCPYCGQNMVKNFASAKHEIEIDECYSCGGTFLDFNELFAIRAQFETEKDRIDHFNKEFLNHFGEAIMAMDEKCKENERNRSLPKKIFDALFFG